MRRIAVIVLLVVSAALVAGCGGSSTAGRDASSAPPPRSTATTTVAAPRSTTPPPVPSRSTAYTGPACATASLGVSFGGSNGEAGTFTLRLLFANKSGSTCTMTGFPGVAFVAPGNGKQVGEAAARSSALTPTVTLPPGGVAASGVKITGVDNFLPTACGPTPVSGLRIYPPANTAAAYVAFPGPGMVQACSKGLSSIAGSNQMSVAPMRPTSTSP